MGNHSTHMAWHHAHTAEENVSVRHCANAQRFHARVHSPLMPLEAGNRKSHLETAHACAARPVRCRYGWWLSADAECGHRPMKNDPCGRIVAPRPLSPVSAPHCDHGLCMVYASKICILLPHPWDISRTGRSVRALVKRNALQSRCHSSYWSRVAEVYGVRNFRHRGRVLLGQPGRRLHWGQ